MRPLVSVGLPVYNGERYIGDALDALQAQTMTEWELRVSDNGSTDATREIVEDRAAEDPRISYVRQPVNRGAAYNFSVVVDGASAPFFKWITHDDSMAPTLLERLLELREQEPDAVLWYSPARELDEHGAVGEVLPDRLPLSQHDPAARLYELLTTYSGSNPLFGIHDIDALRTTRLLDDFHSADVVLLGEIALRGRFVELDEALFHRRWMFRSTKDRDRREVDEWYNPDSRRVHDLKMLRQFREMGRSIARAPLPAGERLRCGRALWAAWGRPYWRHMGGELKNATLRRLGRESSLDY
jgi:glycosyltransferase involved in cell wall biosynthesis